MTGAHVAAGTVGGGAGRAVAAEELPPFSGLALMFGILAVMACFKVGCTCLGLCIVLGLLYKAYEGGVNDGFIPAALAVGLYAVGGAIGIAGLARLTVLLFAWAGMASKQPVRLGMLACFSVACCSL